MREDDLMPHERDLLRFRNGGAVDRTGKIAVSADADVSVGGKLLLQTEKVG